jgi:hypothetical protein
MGMSIVADSRPERRAADRLFVRRLYVVLGFH